MKKTLNVVAFLVAVALVISICFVIIPLNGPLKALKAEMAETSAVKGGKPTADENNLVEELDGLENDLNNGQMVVRIVATNSNQIFTRPVNGQVSQIPVSIMERALMDKAGVPPTPRIVPGAPLPGNQ